MDIVKVHYDEELQGVYGDDCRYFFDVAGKSLGEEVVKRISMHDELVKSLHDMVEIVGSNFCQNMEIKRKYKIARELLERCK